jgi:hypothetical protein
LQVIDPHGLLGSNRQISHGKYDIPNLKRWCGISNLWQQSRTALELWMQIRSTAWTLAQLLSLAARDAFPIEAVAPWRMKHPLTAGLVAQWLRMEFTGLAFRDGFDRKSQKFVFPEIAQRPPLEALALHLSAAVQFASPFRRQYRLIAARVGGW